VPNYLIYLVNQNWFFVDLLNQFEWIPVQNLFLIINFLFSPPIETADFIYLNLILSIFLDSPIFYISYNTIQFNHLKIFYHELFCFFHSIIHLFIDKCLINVTILFLFLFQDP
jgi:hypothetical protein